MLRAFLSLGRKQATPSLLKPVAFTPFFNSQCAVQSFGLRPFFTMQKLSLPRPAPMMVMTPSVQFSLLTRRLAEKRKGTKKYKLKTRKAAVRRFKVVGKSGLLTGLGGLA